jgi:hypothetical protein
VTCEDWKCTKNLKRAFRHAVTHGKHLAISLPSLELSKPVMEYFDTLDRTDAIVCFDGLHTEIMVNTYPAVDHLDLDAYLFEKSGHRIVTSSEPIVNPIDLSSFEDVELVEEEEDGDKLNDMTAFMIVHEKYRSIIKRCDVSEHVVFTVLIGSDIADAAVRRSSSTKPPVCGARHVRTCSVCGTACVRLP